MTSKLPGQGLSITKLKNNLLDLFFPPHCVSCNRIGFLLCKNCQKKISSLDSAIIFSLESNSLSKLIFIGSFQNDLLKEAIHKYKYENVFALAPVFSSILVKRIKNERIDFDLIAYIPASVKRSKWRGYNQAELLAKEISRTFKKPLLTGLTKSKETKTQVGLSRKQRERNLKSSFRYKGPKLTEKVILLIDDVYTTGTTLNECALTLKKKGAETIYGAVIAKE